MIQYRVCVDKDSNWFEYRDTFEEALEVLRDLFEEAGKYSIRVSPTGPVFLVMAIGLVKYDLLSLIMIKCGLSLMEF